MEPLWLPLDVGVFFVALLSQDLLDVSTDRERGREREREREPLT